MNLRVIFSFQNGNLFDFFARLPTFYIVPNLGIFHKQVKNYSRFILSPVRNCLQLQDAVT